MRSTRGSFFSKATGREIRASWGNRIVKDFYDLEYNVGIDRFSNQNKFKNAELVKKRKVQQ